MTAVNKANTVPESEDDARQRHNRIIGKKLIEAGIPVFASIDKSAVVKRWNKLDSTLTVDEKELVRQECENERRPPPTLIGSTLDGRKWERQHNLTRRNGTASICCGLAGVVVIDADVGDGKNGVAKFETFMAEHGGLPKGVIVLTSRSGGRHYVFRDREGKFGNSEGDLTKLDCNVRGRGGQIVAPGSWRADGKRYGTLGDLGRFVAAIKNDTLPELPECVAKAIGNRSSEMLSDSDPQVKAALEELKGEWPDYADVFGDGKRFALDSLQERLPTLRATMGGDVEGRSRSQDRLSIASALKGARATIQDFAAFCLEHSDICGEYVDGACKQGEFNDRALARDWARATAAVWQSTGEQFDAVDDDGDDAAGREETITTIDRLKAAIANADLDDNELAIKALEKELKRAERKLEDKSAKVMAGFLRARDHDDYQAPDDLIEDLIPAVGSTLLVGDSNSGKTFLLLEMVRCLGAGEKFLGRNIEQCGALLVSGEGKGGMGKRLAALRKRWPGADVDAHDNLPDFGENPKAAISHLASILDAYTEMCGRPVRLLALDNLTLMAGKLDPNKPETVNAVLKPLSDFAHERGISVVIAAHENRQGRENGSFAWKALCDNMLTLKTEKGIRTIGFKKAREGDTDAKITCKLDVIDLGTNKWGNPYSSCVVAPHVVFDKVEASDQGDDDDAKLTPPDTTADKITATLRVMREKAERIAEQGGDPMQAIKLTAGDIRAALNRDRSTCGLPPITEPAAVSRILTELVARNDIVREGRSNRAATYRLAA